MSCLTENTIVVKREAEERLVHDLEVGRGWCRIRNETCVFKNDEYVIYVFDANGDQPWDVMFGTEWKKLKLQREDIVATEINYLEGDVCWTRTGDAEIDETLIQYMKKFLTPEEWEVVKEETEYSN